MLSGIGVTELLLLFVIGLLILGPERLPRVASQLGRWVGKARRTANQLRFQMEREIALADIERAQAKKRDKDGDKTGNDQPDGSGSAAAPAAADGSAAGQATTGTASADTSGIAVNRTGTEAATATDDKT